MKVKKTGLTIVAALMLISCQETMEERCQREALDYTKKHCPAVVTEGVTIDSLTFSATTHTLTYYYTVEGVVDDAEQLKKYDLKGALLKELKNSTLMKSYKEVGYNFRYVYYSTKNNGAKLFEATFRKKDYSK